VKVTAAVKVVVQRQRRRVAHTAMASAKATRAPMVLNTASEAEASAHMASN